jgi:DNA replication protein DnaC
MEHISQALPLQREATAQKRSQESWQRLLREGPEAVARDADRRCEYCDAVKPWRVVPHFSGDGRLFAYPLPCDCDGVHEAKQRERNAEQAQMDASLQAFRNRTFAAAGLSGRLQECTFDSFKRRSDWLQAIECAIKVRRYWQAIYGEQFGHKPWLVLYGSFGTGKTHLAAAVAHEAVTAGWSGVHFGSWSEHLTQLKSSWDREQDEDRTSVIVDRLKKGSLVVIDDIDKIESRGWAQGELYNALNYRYNALLPTVLTFNCAPTQADPQALGRMLLERYMGRALIDRIIESAFAMVNFDGPSYRSGVKW